MGRVRKKTNTKKVEKVEEKNEKIEKDLNIEKEEKVEKEEKTVTKKKVKINKKRCILIGCALIVLVAVIYLLVAFFTRVKEYPIIYKGKDNNLYLLRDGDKPEEAVVFSRRDGIGYISFFNDTPRYFLYKKSVDLYLYDVKELKDTKIISDYSASFVTNNDKYVVAVNTVGQIYSYNVRKGKLIQVGEDLMGDIAFTDKAILYETQDKNLTLSFLDGKEKDIEIASNVKAYQFSKDGSKIIYINEDNELISYVIKKKKDTKINEDVEEFYCDSDECDKIYYVMNTDERDILYYNGSKSSVYVKDVYALEAVDVDAELLLYSEKKDDSLVLYLKNTDDESIELNDEYGIGGYARIFDSKYVYYVNGKKTFYVYNIKKDKTTELGKNISGRFVKNKNGYYVFGDVSAGGNGILYSVEEEKIEEIDDNVYTLNYYSINKDGDKIYYYKDYAEKVGSLKVYDGKEASLIAEKVYMYQYVNDKMIYFIKDYDLLNMSGTLYRFDGKKDEQLAEKVQSIVQFNVNQYRK